MNFPLSRLEQHVTEDDLVAGERLFEAQKVQGLRELEKHLWVATVDDCEIELQITPSKVQNFSCECDVFQKKKQCAHLAAGLLALRQHRQQQAERQRKSKSKKQAKRPQRLTPSVILDNVSLEELTDFVRKYASRDRNFALALKARFAGTVAFYDTKEKYLQVLESSIEAARKTNRMISYRGARKLEKVLNELLQQAEIALAQKHLTTSLYIAESIIEKVTPVLRKIEREKELILQRLATAFSLFHQVLDNEPAPDLQEEIWRYCQQECTKLTYRLNNSAIQFYHILLRLANTPLRVDRLLELLDKLLESPQTEEHSFVQFLLAKLSLLEANNRPTEAKVLVQQNLRQPEILLYALRQLLQREDWAATKKLAQEGLLLIRDDATQGKLEDILLEIAQQQQDRTAQGKYARQRLLATLDMSYFFKLKESVNGEWQQVRSALLEAVQERPHSLERRNLIAAIYAEEGMYAELIDFIDQARSLDLLEQYLPDLPSTTKKAALQLFKQLLNAYLDNHLGRTPSQRVRNKISFLHKIGAGRLANELVEEIRATYPERHSLIDELLVF